MSKNNTIMGFPVTETSDLPETGPIIAGDFSDYIVPIGTIPASTPIADALVALRDAGVLSVAECEALGQQVGVRTLGDLVVVLGRGEVADERLATKLRQVLG